MVTDMSDDKLRERMSLGSPMKRLAEPKEIVAVMLMMLSPANTFMTGQCIAVDGGMSAV
jgi:NAD(P)-dependent dehydrogenase (short-subunit alcohol dehydrogenase family)